MLGIYKKKISDNEFLFLPKEPCPYVDRQGLIRCRSSDFYPDMTPVVIEGYMKEKFYYVEKECWISLSLCANGLRIINKKGLDAALTEAVAKGYCDWKSIKVIG